MRGLKYGEIAIFLAAILDLYRYSWKCENPKTGSEEVDEIAQGTE
jgi:hypothetical protein